MRLLVLSHKPPYPIVDGGCLAMSRFIADLCAISRIEHIDYLTLSTFKHGFDSKAFEPVQSTKINFEGISVDTRIKALPALFCLLRKKSYHTERFQQDNVKEILQQKLSQQHYDLVIFESLYAAIYTPFIRTFYKGKIAYRSHNLEFRIWEDLAKNARNPLKSWYLNQLSSTLKKEEQQIWRQADIIFPISQDDQREMEKSTATKIRYLPSSMAKNEWTYIDQENSLCFLGAFDWEPNVEAIRWFVSQIFPKILIEFPSLTFHIAGRKSELIQAELTHPNIQFHGFVDDALAFIRQHGIFVGSLQSGSGIKMKILEAMSVGTPCVLTKKAAEGLSIEQLMPVHANAAAFTLDLIQLLQNQEARQVRGEIGKSFIQKSFSSEFVQQIFMEEMESN
jgi:glycosyltransferase involved in cell wall biosynthesis